MLIFSFSNDSPQKIFLLYFIIEIYPGKTGSGQNAWMNKEGRKKNKQTDAGINSYSYSKEAIIE